MVWRGRAGMETALPLPAFRWRWDPPTDGRNPKILRCSSITEEPEAMPEVELVLVGLVILVPLVVLVPVFGATGDDITLFVTVVCVCVSVPLTDVSTR